MMYKKTLLLVAAALLACMSALAFASDIYSGREVYDMHCQTCHGIDGQPMEPGVPDFSRGDSLYVPDVELVQRLRGGSEHLPSFRGLLTDEELRDVVAYIRTLQR